MYNNFSFNDWVSDAMVNNPENWVVYDSLYGEVNVWQPPVVSWTAEMPLNAVVFNRIERNTNLLKRASTIEVYDAANFFPEKTVEAAIAFLKGRLNA